MKNKIGIKSIFLIGLIIITISFILTINLVYTLKEERIDKIEVQTIQKNAKYNYQVYLDGNKIGIIDSDQALYDLINDEQTEIKKQYNVDQVYPPKGFNIIKIQSYTTDTTTVENVYNTIKEKKQFTIKGYTITIKKANSEAEPYYIYVLDDKIFEKAVNNIVNTFIGQERFNQYKEGTQPEIVETGYIIENMKFSDTITVRESYISVDERIFTDETELTRYLLFGDNNETKEYTVVQGDTVSTIAEANQLNVGELLIANTNLRGEDSLLAIGQKLNVALINPLLSLSYDQLVVEDIDIRYTTVTETDSSKYVDYKVTKVNGSNGIERVTSRRTVVNGETLQGGEIVGRQTIKPVVNEVVVKGTKQYVTGPSFQPVDIGGSWGWPTMTPYVITSHYGYRWGTLHNGMDISGTGYGSPIFASQAGTVVSAQYGGMVGSAAGLNVVIEHPNGYYTVYAHCSKLYVSKGEQVAKGQRIAAMGNTGNVTGTHLHFGVYYGMPYNGGKSMDPRNLWR